MKLKEINISKEYIQNNISNFELLSISTNKVYSFQYNNNNYILKIRNQSKDNLSPFWQSLKDIYGSTFDKQGRGMKELMNILAKNPHMDVPKFIEYNEDMDYLIYEKSNGVSWGADEFPREVSSYQLGKYIGYMHSITFDSCGMYPTLGIEDIRERMFQSMLNIIDTYWTEDKEVKEYYEKLKEEELLISGYSLIMADISGNQFLYSDDMKTFTTNIDFDAYVVGPREWELSLISECISDMELFKKGYEKYIPMPDYTLQRKFYQFLMNLNNPWDKSVMFKYLQELLK